MKKKGVSPLIATVLLIAFAVALGAVVMNWGKAQFSEEEVGMCDIDFGIEDLGNSPSVCTQENVLKALAYNNGNKKINLVKVTLFSTENSPHNTEIKTAIGPGETEQLLIDIPADFADISKVKLTPILTTEDSLQDTVCSANIVEVLQPGTC